MADDRIALRHALHAERKCGRHHCRQTFGHRGHGEGDTEDEHLEQRREATHVFDQDDRCDHRNGDHDDDDPQQSADARELGL
jgi:hypothetical protein